MKAFARSLCVLSLTAFCVACGGGGSGGGAALSPVVNVSPGGIWVGIDSDGELVIAFITETGRFHFLDEFGNQGFGVLSVSNGNDVTANFQLVTILGLTFPDGTTLADCTLSGTVTERLTMSVIANCTTTAGLQDQTTVTLDYFPNYERDSSLATITGTYDDGFGIVTDIASDGTIFAQDPVSGCVTNGQVRVIDPAFNAYDFQFEFNNCAGSDAILNGASFVGIGTLDNTDSPEALIVIATGEVAGTLVSWVIFTERLSAPPPPPPPPPPPQTPGGIWSGQSVTAGSTDDIGCVVTETLQFACVITDTVTGDVVASSQGTVQIANGDQVSGSGTLYAIPGFTLNDGSTVAALTITGGTVSERTTLDLTIDAAGATATVSTTYDTIYDRGSNLATVAAVYTTFDIFGDTSTFAIDASGGITALSNTGCVINGQVSIIDPAYNAYDIALDVTNCGGLNGMYDGLGLTQDSAAIDDVFVFAVFTAQTVIVGEAEK